MISFLFRLLEPRIQATITNRIVDFHDAMLARAQITPPTPGEVGIILPPQCEVHSLREYRDKL